MKKFVLFRNAVLIFFLILFSFYSLKHFVVGPEGSASVDALCPFGGFESLYSLISSGYFVPRVMVSSLILAIAVLATVFFFKRSFCGWICPFGAVQEFIGKISKKKITIPEKVDKYGRYLKYIVLAWIIIGTAIAGTLVFRGYDPFMTFFHFGKGILWDYSAEEFGTHIIPFILTILVLLAAVFIERFWCKYFCPLGAVTALFSKLGLTKIKRNTDTCSNCGICDKVCPVNVKVKEKKAVVDAECINCSICVEKCPEKSLNYFTINKKINTAALAALSIVLIFGSVFTAKAFNIWKSVPEISDYSSAGRTLQGEDIRGTMTLQDVSIASGISTEIIIQELGLPAYSSITLPFKSFSDIYKINFHTQAVRDFIDAYNTGTIKIKETVKNNEGPTCPWNLKNDSYPGKCGLYDDQDGNNICDLSE